MERNAFPAFLLTVALSVSAALAQGPGGGGFNPGGGGFNPGGGDQPGGGGGGGSLVYDDFITACTTNSGIVLRDGVAIGTTATATSLTAPAGMTAILPGAFAGNTAITSANLSAATGLTEIPASAFAGCTALKTVTLPSSVTSIGDGAFEGCTALATLTASGVDTIGANAFRGCAALKTQPAGTAIGDYAFAQSGLTSVSLASATLGEGVCYGCASLASATFPENLPDATFGGCTALAIDPSGLSSIGAAALAGVPFTEVTFATSEMGDYAVAADTAWEAWTLTWAGTAATNATTFLGRGEAPGEGLALGAIADQTYTGAAIEPELDVTYDGVAVSGYTASFDGNTDVGTATVTVAYGDATVTGTFAIVAADIAGASLDGVESTYTAGSVALSPVLAFNGTTLAEGTDYAWTVTDTSGEETADYPTTPGDYTLVVTGQGNFTGTQSQAFTVVSGGGTVETAFASVSDIQFSDGTLSLALTVDDDLSAATVAVYVTDDLLSGTWREATEAAVTVSGTSISIEGIATGDTSKLFLRFGLE